MVKLLGLSAVIMIISLFTGNSVFFVSSFTIFIIITLINMCILWIKNGKFSKLNEFNDKKVIEEFKSKKYLHAGIRFISLPMCAVGGIFVILSLILMWKSCLNL